MLYVHIKQVQESRWIMQTRNTKIGWSIWFQWFLASIFGYGIGAAIGNAIAVSMPPPACADLWCILPGLDLTLLVVVPGLAGGFMQWLILRRYIAKAGWWILANALGFPIALLIAVGAGMSLGGDSLAAPILMGVVFGALSGIMFWLILRRRVARASWWVPAHLLGSLAGGALGIVVFHSVGLIGFYQFTWAAAGAMFGAGLGAVTGSALVWLLRPFLADG